MEGIVSASYWERQRESVKEYSHYVKEYSHYVKEYSHYVK